MFYPENHVELYLHCMRDRGRTFVDILLPQARERLQAYNFKQKISEFLHINKDKNILFSAEGLSYLRGADEIKLLKELLQSPFHNVIVLWVHRPIDEVKLSYVRQIERTKGARISHNRESVFYISDDSFLWETEALRKIYSSEFEFHEFDYSSQIIVELLEYMNLPLEDEIIWENKTDNSRVGKILLIIKKMLRKIHRKNQ